MLSIAGMKPSCLCQRTDLRPTTCRQPPHLLKRRSGRIKSPTQRGGRSSKTPTCQPGNTQELLQTRTVLAGRALIMQTRPTHVRPDLRRRSLTIALAATEWRASAVSGVRRHPAAARPGRPPTIAADLFGPLFPRRRCRIITEQRAMIRQSNCTENQRNRSLQCTK